MCPSLMEEARLFWITMPVPLFTPPKRHWDNEGTS